MVLGGCSPTYVIRAGYEEAKILWRREPIATVLARPDLEPEVRRKLELVLDARRYAEGIGIKVGGSFTTLSYVDGPTMLYVLTATPQTSLEPHTWWFPIIGSVPYKGFFDRARAEAEAKTLVERGLDTSIRGAAAFSTLGWFDDPLLRHQLAADDVALVNLVLHETYHNTFYAQVAPTRLRSTSRSRPSSATAPRSTSSRPVRTAVSARRRRARRGRTSACLRRFVQTLATHLRELYAAQDAAASLGGREVLFQEAREAFPVVAASRQAVRALRRRAAQQRRPPAIAPLYDRSRRVR